MNVTIATDDRVPFVLPLSSDTDLATLKTVLEADTGIPRPRLRILFNGREITHPDSTTIGSLGVADGSLLYVTRLLPQSQPQNANANASSAGWQTHRPPQQQQQQQQQQQPAVLSPRNYLGLTLEDVPPNCDPRILREIVRVNPPAMAQLEHMNPELARAAAQDDAQLFVDTLMKQRQQRNHAQRSQRAEMAALRRRVEENPFDVEAQRRVEELIRTRNVESNHTLAREIMPESFTRVCMLYINAEVNGMALKAFVDSGAQNTIMTQACAERCGIMRLIDTRYAGQAVGVGTCKILGRVHMAQLKIGDQNFNCSFTVLENAGGGRQGQSVEFLFGLDMLKRHQASINLKTNRLEIEGSQGTISVPFLGEAEIPNNDFNPTAKPRDGSRKSASASSSASQSASGSSSSSSMASNGISGPTTSGTPSPANISIDKQAEKLAQELLEAMDSGDKDEHSSASSGDNTSSAATPQVDKADTKRSRQERTTALSAPASSPVPVPAPAPAPAPSASPAPAQPSASPSISEESISTLTNMGFSRDQAKRALVACNGDAAAAIVFLIQFS